MDQQFATKKPERRATYVVEGSHIVFLTSRQDQEFRPHLNYVVDTERLANRRKKIKSLEARVRREHNLFNELSKDEELLKDIIIEIDHNAVPHEREENKNGAGLNSGSLKGKSRWTVLRSVLKAVSLFRRNEVESIHNEQELEQALTNCKYRHRSNSVMQQRAAFLEHFKEERFYELIAKGSPADIREIDQFLSADRRTYLHDASDPKSILNAPNRLGKTPLYIATQNGSLAMVKYLISAKANPLIKSKVSATEEENNLSVAARWKHIKIVEFYIDFYDWPYEELKKAYKVAGNAAVKEMLKKQMAEVKPKSGWLCCMPVAKTKQPKL